MFKHLVVFLFLACLLEPAVFASNSVEDGVLLYQRHLYQAAKRQFLRSISSDPTNAAAQYHLANTYVHLGEHQLAQKHYRLVTLLDVGGVYGRFAAQALSGYSENQANLSASAPNPQALKALATTGSVSLTAAPKFSEERSMLYQHGVWQKDDGSGTIDFSLPPHTNSPIGGTSQFPGSRRSQIYYGNTGGYNLGGRAGFGYVRPASLGQHFDRHHEDHHE